MHNGAFSSLLESQQTQSPRSVLNYQTVEMYEQQPRQQHVFSPGGSPLIFKSIADRGADFYFQKKPGEESQTNERLNILQRSYTFLGDVADIAEVLAHVPPLYSLLNAAVEPLHVAFGDRKLLLLEALNSDDDTVLRVIVKLSQDTEAPAALMRKFKLAWWFKNCSRSEASLVFDYEIGNGF